MTKCKDCRLWVKLEGYPNGYLGHCHLQPVTRNGGNTVHLGDNGQTVTMGDFLVTDEADWCGQAQPKEVPGA